MFDFSKLTPEARRAAFANMSAADKVVKARKHSGGAAHRMTQAKRADSPLRADAPIRQLSSQYVRTGRPTSDDVDTMVENYRRMHGKPPSAAQLARLRRRVK